MPLLETILHNIIDLLARRGELPSRSDSFVVAPEKGIIDRRLLPRRLSDLVPVRF